jgi:hypothetical protein
MNNAAFFALIGGLATVAWGERSEPQHWQPRSRWGSLRSPQPAETLNFIFSGQIQ